MTNEIRTAHIVAKKSDFAKTVIMPGDPLRSKYIAEKFLKDAKLISNIRGIQAYTGLYKNKRVTVMAHGMGMPSMGIYAHELFAFCDVKNIIRVGTCGCLVKQLKVRDILLGEFAYTTSNFSKHIGYNKKKIECDSELLDIAEKTILKLDKKYVKCGILTSDLFYTDEKQTKYAKKGCWAVEMELFALYSVAKKFNKHALGIFTVSDNILTGENTTAEERQTGFDNMIISALETAIKLK